MISNIGKFIEIHTEKNKDLSITKVLGINIEKKYINSVANTIGTDLSKYKVIEKNMFACNPMHVGRDKMLPVSLYKSRSKAIVSPAYLTFRIKKDANILPEYLMLYFKSSYFDNLMWFKSDSSVRGGISFDDIKNAKINEVDIDRQKEIIDEFNSIDSLKINLEKQNKNLYEIINKIFNDLLNTFESNSLDWNIKTIDQISKKVICGSTPSTSVKEYWENGNVPFLTIPDMHDKLFQIETERKITEEGLNSKKTRELPPKSIAVSCIASAGLSVLTTSKCITNQQINSIICQDDISPYFVLMTMKNMANVIVKAGDGGTVAANLSNSEFKKLLIKVPSSELMQEFDRKTQPMFKLIELNERKINNISKLENYLLLDFGKDVVNLYE